MDLKKIVDAAAPILTRALQGKSVTTEEIARAVGDSGVTQSLAEVGVDVAALRGSAMPQLLAALATDKPPVPSQPLPTSETSTQTESPLPASKSSQAEDINESGIKKWVRRAVVGVLSLLGFKNLVDAESSWARPILYFLSAIGVYKFTGPSKPVERQLAPVPVPQS